MTFEQLVGDALRAADDFLPSPDLFAKVQRSIDEDAEHRARVKRGLMFSAVAAVFVVAYLALTVNRSGGAISMSFLALETLVTVAMVGLVLVLGPAIRRFGEQYEQACFVGSPATGRRVLRLLDIAYYLIFLAFIAMTLVFDPALQFDPNLAAWVLGESIRIAGLMLLMGVLHVALVLALPLAGLVHAANEWRIRVREGAESTDAVAPTIDRVLTVVAWVVAAVVVLLLVFGVLNGILVLGASG